MIEFNNECLHESCLVFFDENVAQTMTEKQIRKLYPRFHGTCPTCKQNIIKYASAAHYVMGDW